MTSAQKKATLTCEGHAQACSARIVYAQCMRSSRAVRSSRALHNAVWMQTRSTAELTRSSAAFNARIRGCTADAAARIALDMREVVPPVLLSSALERLPTRAAEAVGTTASMVAEGAEKKSRTGCGGGGGGGEGGGGGRGRGGGGDAI